MPYINYGSHASYRVFMTSHGDIYSGPDRGTAYAVFNQQKGGRFSVTILHGTKVIEEWNPR